MPKGGHTNWFRELFGFDEGGSYSKNQAMFCMEGHTLICQTSPYPRQYVGPWEMPSLKDLRSMCASANVDGDLGGLRFTNLADPVGVVSLIMNPDNAGAVFQAASQFNALEMVGPGVTPRQGIAIYATDPTQGPKCALACPAGTVFRNYLVGGVGQGHVQIDCLADVSNVVGNKDGRYWNMQNGYALPSTPTSMAALSARLAEEPGLAEAAEAALRVGVHWDTQVKPPHDHRVVQVYASAVPVAYAKSTKSADWEAFARLVLRGAYEATLAVARCKSNANEGQRIKIFLTALGGGSFGNRSAWITDAITNALEIHRDAPLDVVLVHYGSMVKSEWAGIMAPKPTKGESAHM
mmetsp:Transcript_46574/g.76975  ORF Transcript_46574/g.76975 Transcript_46574/m.76975 type:complete len:351 (-) Transcript_46574:182-1234(-)|eukprot:CAMPEP_0119302442 /NCGR_PEP_ID=MMETSP1333-20130426/4026_1 /TAXON_ID=418940 /ORGANISM="Scyphosphaera apsteinii, Strain RCC1455" /LENGTH=350 /DNA_ID=CAMNT_0007304789 /DNA_START=88 /DNA_END=1140 /DNA_ORIENTATION=-